MGDCPAVRQTLPVPSPCTEPPRLAYLPACLPLGSPHHSPGPLTSHVRWLWGLESPSPSLPPAPAPALASFLHPTPSVPPTHPGLELSQAQSHSHPLSPALSPPWGAQPSSARPPPPAAWVHPGPRRSRASSAASTHLVSLDTGPQPVHSWLLGDPRVPGRWAPPASHSVGGGQRQGAPGPRAPLASLTAWEACHHLETTDITLDVILFPY